MKKLGSLPGVGENRMKALSIKEPWATFILEGTKTIETRTWKTKYRGKVLLCASKTPNSDISGKAFATATIIDCDDMIKGDEKFACCEMYPKAQSWFLDDVKPIKPFEVKGQLGLFEVEYPPLELKAITYEELKDMKCDCKNQIDAQNNECTPCGMRDCPHDEPQHYHHDGCPACINEEVIKDGFLE